MRRRRLQLGAWGFGECACERCMEEEKEPEKKNVDDLELELKAGLGVM